MNDEIETLKKNYSCVKESKYKLVQQYNELVEDYNKLQEEYKKLLDIRDEMQKELEINQIWQKETTNQETLMEKKINKMEDHIW